MDCLTLHALLMVLGQCSCLRDTGNETEFQWLKKAVLKPKMPIGNLSQLIMGAWTSRNKSEGTAATSWILYSLFTHDNPQVIIQSLIPFSCIQLCSVFIISDSHLMAILLLAHSNVIFFLIILYWNCTGGLAVRLNRFYLDIHST